MQAVRVHQFAVPNAMKLETIQDPMPGPGQVRIRLANAGINPNETYVLTGTYAFYTPELPFTPGFDGAGIIDALGEDVTSFRLGDRVYLAGFMAPVNTGTYAEKVVASASHVHALPDNVSFAQGAALGIPAAAAYRAVFIQGEVTRGTKVFIHGASGGVGLVAIQLAKAAGATVIGSASSEAGRQLILETGADRAMDHLSKDNLDELRELAGGTGPDVIIEFLANHNLAMDMEVIARYGRIIVIGNRGTIEINPRLLMGKDSQIRGLGIPNYRPEEYEECFRTIHEYLVQGRLIPVVGRHFSLEEANEAHRIILDQKTRGKLIFDCQAPSAEPMSP